MSEQDPYCYSQSEVLRNSFDFRNQADLSKAEARLTVLRLDQLQKRPVAGKFDLEHLRDIHRHIFRDVYPWAGQLRTVSMSKGASLFCRQEFLADEGKRIFDQLKRENVLRALPQETFCGRLAYYFGEINALHPFREGNGRSQRVLLGDIARQAGYQIDFRSISRESMIEISRDAQGGRLESVVASFNAATTTLPARAHSLTKQRCKARDEGR
ncbi:MAG: Fic family protein [Rhodospirillales bacterium]|nr:Fic family protein [Acetobacter sp.]